MGELGSNTMWSVLRVVRDLGWAEWGRTGKSPKLGSDGYGTGFGSPAGSKVQGRAGSVSGLRLARATGNGATIGTRQRPVRARPCWGGAVRQTRRNRKRQPQWSMAKELRAAFWSQARKQIERWSSNPVEHVARTLGGTSAVESQGGPQEAAAGQSEARKRVGLN